jgi:hypothetical protein
MTGDLADDAGVGWTATSPAPQAGQVRHDERTVLDRARGGLMVADS